MDPGAHRSTSVQCTEPHVSTRSSTWKHTFTRVLNTRAHSHARTHAHTHAHNQCRVTIAVQTGVRSIVGFFQQSGNLAPTVSSPSSLSDEKMFFLEIIFSHPPPPERSSRGLTANSFRTDNRTHRHMYRVKGMHLYMCGPPRALQICTRMRRHTPRKTSRPRTHASNKGLHMCIHVCTPLCTREKRMGGL